MFCFSALQSLLCRLPVQVGRKRFPKLQLRQQPSEHGPFQPQGLQVHRLLQPHLLRPRPLHGYGRHLLADKARHQPDHGLRRTRPRDRRHGPPAVNLDRDGRRRTHRIRRRRRLLLSLELREVHRLQQLRVGGQHDGLRHGLQGTRRSYLRSGFLLRPSQFQIGSGNCLIDKFTFAFLVNFVFLSPFVNKNYCSNLPSFFDRLLILIMFFSLMH